ncbi:MAG TPA: hypothetical protein VFF30_00680 [Nitrososphaerales archaeon]|nr:hypothetical protein [Nitrososphaerales archaeon]
MNQDEIKERFKQVSDQVDAMASQLEREIQNKNASIREEAAKKFAGAVGS